MDTKDQLRIEALRLAVQRNPKPMVTITSAEVVAEAEAFFGFLNHND